MSHTIRFKLRCNSVTDNPHSPGMSSVQFGAVYSPDTGNPDDENAVFGKLTPFGNFTTTFITEVASKLQPGKDYYFDVHPADAS